MYVWLTFGFHGAVVGELFHFTLYYDKVYLIFSFLAYPILWDILLILVSYYNLNKVCQSFLSAFVLILLPGRSTYAGLTLIVRGPA